MKPARFILVVVIVAVLGIVLWWCLRPVESGVGGASPSPAVATKQTSEPDKAATVPPAPSVPQTVETPVLPAATMQALAVKTAPSDTDPNAASRAELNAAFADMARLYREGDTAGFMRTYREPSKLQPEQVQTVQQAQDAVKNSPDVQPNSILVRIREDYSKAYAALAEQKPTFNAAGDEATYTFNRPGLGFHDDMPEPMVFIKINGKWYIKTEPQPAGSSESMGFGTRQQLNQTGRTSSP